MQGFISLTDLIAGEIEYDLLLTSIRKFQADSSDSRFMKLESRLFQVADETIARHFSHLSYLAEIQTTCRKAISSFINRIIDNENSPKQAAEQFKSLIDRCVSWLTVAITHHAGMLSNYLAMRGKSEKETLAAIFKYVDRIMRYCAVAYRRNLSCDIDREIAKAIVEIIVQVESAKYAQENPHILRSKDFRHLLADELSLLGNHIQIELIVELVDTISAFIQKKYELIDHLNVTKSAYERTLKSHSLFYSKSKVIEIINNLKVCIKEAENADDFITLRHVSGKSQLSTSCQKEVVSSVPVLFAPSSLPQMREVEVSRVPAFARALRR